MKLPIRNRSSGSSWRKDLSAAFVVFLLALPLCMGIAVECGLSHEKGVVTSIAGGVLIVASLKFLKRRELND